MAGSPQRYFQEVVLKYEGDDCLIWPFSTSEGYGRIGDHVVSRLLCEEIHGPPPTPDHQAAHGCGRGHEGCVAKGHPSWKAPVANNADKKAHGTFLRGARANTAKLTEEQVREIRHLKKDGLSAIEIGGRFGISQWSVFDIASRRTWGWLEDVAA